MVFQALLSTGSTWFSSGSGGVNGVLLASAAKESPVAGLRPVDISSARTFAHLPPDEHAHRDEGEASLLDACAQKLQDWENEDEVAPLWTGQRNYGTFIRPRYGSHRTAQPNVKSDTGQKDGAKGEDHSCIVHEVTKNDTLPALALKYNVLVSDILTVNGVTRTAGSSLLVRKTIRIPKAEVTSLAEQAANQTTSVTLACGQSRCERSRDENDPPSPYAAKEKLRASVEAGRSEAAR